MSVIEKKTRGIKERGCEKCYHMFSRNTWKLPAHWLAILNVIHMYTQAVSQLSCPHTPKSAESSIEASHVATLKWDGFEFNTHRTEEKRKRKECISFHLETRTQSRAERGGGVGPQTLRLLWLSYRHFLILFYTKSQVSSKLRVVKYFTYGYCVLGKLEVAMLHL